MKILSELKDSQKSDGSWRYCFENSIMTDAYMIILIRSLKIKDEELIKQLAKRLLALQTREGTWKLFQDENEGNLSATVEAYFALLYSGHLSKDDVRLEKAREFIVRSGGLGKVHSITKFMLATHGQYDWNHFFPIPIQFLMIPKSFPISFWDFSSYARIHLAPMMLLKDKQYTVTNEITPDITQLANNRVIATRDIVVPLFIKDMVKQISSIPSTIQIHSQQVALQYMLQRIEADGTYYSYFSSTFFMIYALLSMGYKKTDPIILKAYVGLRNMIYETESGLHVQNSPSTIWDTSLIAYAIQEAGMSSKDMTIQNSVSYLLQQQHYKFGDWAIEQTKVIPGGWGFSQGNTIHPDIDDTTAALRAITNTVITDTTIRQSWDRGVRWLLAMQNKDGGWPAFEPNKTKQILTSFPMDGAEAASIDFSSADLTGRTLEFLGNYAGFTKDHPKIKRAINWLQMEQEINGSWYGRWGICYLYGTWAAVTGMRAVGISKKQSSLIKARKWLIEVQNDDGGWGESCYSDQYKKFVPLGKSTPSQTAWALDALISLCSKPTPEIQRGIEALHNMVQEGGYSNYPTGAGLPGNFYIRYHSYHLIWPLLTLSHYVKKYS